MQGTGALSLRVPDPVSWTKTLPPSADPAGARRERSATRRSPAARIVRLSL